MPMFWKALIINGCWILSKAYSASTEITIWFLSFSLLIWYITLIDLHILKNPWIPGINPTYQSVWAFWCVAEICLLKFCWRCLHLCSSVMLAYSFLFCVVFLWFWYHGDGGLQEWIWSVPSSAIFWKSFRRIGVSSSLNIW